MTQIDGKIMTLIQRNKIKVGKIIQYAKLYHNTKYRQNQNYYIVVRIILLIQFISDSLLLSEILNNMGLLSDLGEILTPQETAKLQPFLKKIGIQQFIYILKKYRNWQKTTKSNIIKWGEQIQGHFLVFNKKGQLQLCLEPLSQQYQDVSFPLVLEYGRWMFEMTPSQPYLSQCNFQEIINTIKKKYQYLQAKSRIALTIPNVPFLGVRDPQNEEQFDNTITNSLYIHDKHIANHLRFRTLTKNIRLRRGSNVKINVPIFVDKNTTKQQLLKTQPNADYINMDAMAFGMGMACLQCTFSTQNLDHARYIYDQMHVISPLMLAITAGTPFYKGKVSNWDVRWKVIEDSVDCRNEQQRNEKSESYLPSSRYSQAQLYIWPGQFNKPEYNNVKLNINPEIKQYIRKVASQYSIEIDQYLLNHIANIFKRDFLIAHEKFKQMTPETYTLFQMLNGTNWNSVRLKIPIDDNIGWRVEFRTMQVQLTAQQNSAYSLLIHFFTRVLHKVQNLNLYIPMNLVKQNFDRAHLIDAARKQKFYFRTNIFDKGEPIIQELSLDQIFFGYSKQQKKFVGIFNYVRQILINGCLQCEKKCPKFNQLVQQVMEFLHDKTSGKRLTLAQWMRNFVMKHPEYKHNSILSKKTMDDLLLTLNQISRGTLADQNFEKIFHP